MGLEGGEVVVGPDGVVGRLMEGTMFVVDGTEGVVGALIVVVGLGNWLGGPAGRPATFSIFNSQRVSFRGTFLSYRIEKKGEMRGVKKIQTWRSLRTGLCRRYQTVGPVGPHRRPDSRSRHSANGSRPDADLKTTLKAPRI